MRNLLPIALLMLMTTHSYAETTCYIRSYDANHMNRHPGQKLSKIFLQLETLQGNDQALTGRLVGVAPSGQLFGAIDYSCSREIKDTKLCTSNSDNGIFQIVPDAGNSILVQLNTDDDVLLFSSNVANPGHDTQGNLVLKHNDPENNIWKLFPTLPSACDEAVKTISQL